MNPLIQLQKAAPVFVVALVCVGLLSKTQAVVPRPPGGYPNFTTAVGDNALQALTLGVGNTALGTFSSFSVTTGSFNTAVGAGALDLNAADSNTATGAAALLFNTTGTENTANGTAALEFNTTGDVNTATGAFALFNNTEGDFNTANGVHALFNNTEGGFNTATGYNALSNNTTGTQNTAIGVHALSINTTGNKNTALGDRAGQTISGDGNVCIGFDVEGEAGVDDTTWIRNINTTNFPFIAGTNNYVTVRMSDGALGWTTVVSSRRYKEDTKPMEKASEALLALKPVTFRLKGELDPNHRPQWGLIAEEVEKVHPDLVDRNNKGEVESVRYDAVNAMLLNEFLKEHKTVQEQGATITELKSHVARQGATIAHQQKQIEALTAGLQKVSAQLEASKPAPQTVANK